MANEVIIEEYSGTGTHSGEKARVPIPGTLVTTQVLDIAEESLAFDATTAFLRLQSKGSGFWYQLGGVSPVCVANTPPARWLPADQFRDIAVNPSTDLKLQTAT